MENNAEVVDLNLLLPGAIGEETEETNETPELKIGQPSDFLADTLGILPLDEESNSQTTPEKEIEETPEIVLETPRSEIDYRTALKNVFGDSVQKFDVPGEDGELSEVSIDDIEITQEIFEAILQGRIEQIKEEEQQDKVSIRGVSEFTKSLIEIDKHGGDVRQLLEVKDAYLDPLNELDLSTIDGQRRAVYLRLIAANQPEQDIQLLIESYEAKGLLPEKAQQSESELRAAISQQIELQKQAAIQSENDRKEMLKNYRKELKEGLSVFQLSDTVKSRLADIASKELDKGKFQLDELYNQARKDPKIAAELVLFLHDRNEYISQVSEKKVLEKQIQTGQRLKIIPKRGTAETIIDKSDKSAIPLNILNP